MSFKTKLKDKLTSRKFWMGLLAAVIPFFNKTVLNEAVPTEQIIAVIGALTMYILGEAHVDRARVE